MQCVMLQKSGAGRLLSYKTTLRLVSWMPFLSASALSLRAAWILLSSSTLCFVSSEVSPYHTRTQQRTNQR